MSKYKTPMTRQEFRDRVDLMIKAKLDDFFGENDLVESTFNRIADEAVGNYNDQIEDGDSHKAAKKQADETFWEEILGEFQETMGSIFDEIQEEIT